MYLNAAIEQLKGQDYPVREEDAVRLSPFVRKHLRVHGTYSFAVPEREPGAIRTSATPTHPTARKTDLAMPKSRVPPVE